METTPDKHCIWKVDIDHLEECLTDIHRHGSTVIAVTPYKFTSYRKSGNEELFGRDYEVTMFIIVYYNQPMMANVAGGIGGTGAPIQ